MASAPILATVLLLGASDIITSTTPIDDDPDVAAPAAYQSHDHVTAWMACVAQYARKFARPEHAYRDAADAALGFCRPMEIAATQAVRHEMVGKHGRELGGRIADEFLKDTRSDLHSRAMGAAAAELSKSK